MLRNVSVNVVFFVGFGIGAIAIGQLLPERIGSGRDLPGPPPPERFGTQRQRRPDQRPRRPPPDLGFDVASQRPELTIDGWVLIFIIIIRRRKQAGSNPQCAEWTLNKIEKISTGPSHGERACFRG